MLKKSIVLLFAGLILVGISGCEKEEGAMEKAGKSIDQATTEAGESLDQASESVKETYEDTKDVVLDKEPAEKAGESIDDAVKSVSE